MCFNSGSSRVRVLPADGFWDRVLTPVPTYNDAFLFKEIQKGGIGDDAAGLVARASIDGRPSGATPAGHDASIQPTTEMHERRLQSSNGTDYPTLQVEIGGGMETSYHRRIHVDSDDMGAEAVVQLGSGTNCLGGWSSGGWVMLAAYRARLPSVTAPREFGVAAACLTPPCFRASSDLCYIQL